MIDEVVVTSRRQLIHELNKRSVSGNKPRSTYQSHFDRNWHRDKGIEYLNLKVVGPRVILFIKNNRILTLKLVVECECGIINIDDIEMAREEAEKPAGKILPRTIIYSLAKEIRRNRRAPDCSRHNR